MPTLEQRLMTLAAGSPTPELSVSTVRRLVAEGELPVLHVRGSLRVDPAELHRYLIECHQ